MWVVEVFMLFLVVVFNFFEFVKVEFKNCICFVVYLFGDLLMDNGNGIVIFLDQFIDFEINFNGFNFLYYVVDWYCDGWFLVDYIGKLFLVVFFF